MSGRTHAVRLPPERAPSLGPFLDLVWAGDARLDGLRDAPPTDEKGWARAMGAFARDVSVPPAPLVEALIARQGELGAGARAESSARALGRPGTLAVVTGQQPGLLGGPLHTLHKAAGAVALARHLDGIGGHRVVPVFWLASEDHDWGEANQLWLLDEAGQERRLALDVESDGRSILDLEVPRSASEALEAELAELLPETDRAQAAITALARPAAADMAAWSAYAITTLLGDTGLVIFDPAVYLPHQAEAIRGVVRSRAAIHQAVEETGARLAELGVPPPLTTEADVPALFLRDGPGGRRRRLRETEPGRFLPEGTDTAMSEEELLATIAAHPERASGDVVGRVFVQNALLPALVYLAGPTELAYHTQVRAAHRAAGAVYGFALPRPSATWVDGKARRIAEALELDPAAVVRGEAEPPSTERDDLDGPFARWEAAAAAPEALRRAADGPEGRAALDAVDRRVREAIERGRDRLEAALARDLGVGTERFQRLASALRPRGRLQERSLSALSLAARHGFAPLREGLAQLDALSMGHFLIHLP